MQRFGGVEQKLICHLWGRRSPDNTDNMQSSPPVPSLLSSPVLTTSRCSAELTAQQWARCCFSPSLSSVNACWASSEPSCFTWTVSLLRLCQFVRSNTFGSWADMDCIFWALGCSLGHQGLFGMHESLCATVTLVVYYSSTVAKASPSLFPKYDVIEFLCTHRNH